MLEKNKFTIFEGMTSVSALIKASESFPLTARKINTVYCDKKNIKSDYRRVNFLKAKSNELGFSLEFCDSEIINGLVTGKTHGGFVALCGEKTIKSISFNDIPQKGIFYLIEGIEDPYNFGYTLRALYASGADGVVLPERNWMTAAGTVSKASAGCSELIPIYSGAADESVKLFKDAGYRVLCANIRDSKLIYDTDLRAPVLFVIGGEKRGVSRTVLDLSDQNIRIGYGRDFSGSLPTAEAAAIIAFEAAKINARIK